MSATIDLLRHGDTGFTGFRGSLDDELTASGWQQMEQGVAGQHWEVIVSSPLRRCAAFAERFSMRTGLPLHLDARLQELHFGTWEGKTAEQVMKNDAALLEHFWRDPEHHAPPGGETLAMFSVRVLAAWQALQQRHAGQRVLVVTHGGVIRRLLCEVRGLPLGEMLSLAVPHGSLHRLGQAGGAA